MSINYTSADMKCLQYAIIRLFLIMGHPVHMTYNMKPIQSRVLLLNWLKSEEPIKLTYCHASKFSKYNLCSVLLVILQMYAFCLYNMQIRWSGRNENKLVGSLRFITYDLMFVYLFHEDGTDFATFRPTKLTKGLFKSLKNNNTILKQITPIGQSPKLIKTNAI